MMESPLVSIVCATYNHEPYLARALDGFLMQETTFPIEIILAEDCSTDGTRQVIEDWLDVNVEERQEGNLYLLKNGMLLRYIWSENNVGATANEKRAMAAASGKYIAFCEGDDYWIDSKKLQKQVDFLEENPEYVVCFARCKHYDVESASWKNDNCECLFRSGNTVADVTSELLFSRWYTQPLTMMFVKEVYDLDWYDHYKYFRDLQQIFLLLQRGKGCILNFDSGVRLIHDGGMASQDTRRQTNEKLSLVMEELYRDYPKDVNVRRYYAFLLQEVLYLCGHFERIKFSYAWKLLRVDGNIRHFFRNVMR